MPSRFGGSCSNRGLDVQLAILLSIVGLGGTRPGTLETLLAPADPQPPAMPNGIHADRGNVELADLSCLRRDARLVGVAVAGILRDGLPAQGHQIRVEEAMLLLWEAVKLLREVPGAGPALRIESQSCDRRLVKRLWRGSWAAYRRKPR